MTPSLFFQEEPINLHRILSTCLPVSIPNINSFLPTSTNAVSFGTSVWSACTQHLHNSNSKFSLSLTQTCQINFILPKINTDYIRQVTLSISNCNMSVIKSKHTLTFQLKLGASVNYEHVSSKCFSLHLSWCILAKNDVQEYLRFVCKGGTFLLLSMQALTLPSNAY